MNQIEYIECVRRETIGKMVKEYEWVLANAVSTPALEEEWNKNISKPTMSRLPLKRGTDANFVITYRLADQHEIEYIRNFVRMHHFAALQAATMVPVKKNIFKRFAEKIKAR